MEQSTPFEAPTLEELEPLFPSYTFLEIIAMGGMGAVYLAKQESLDRQVAIKILPKQMGEDPNFKEQFTKEAKAMARLNHPNILSVYDFGAVDEMPFIVMEFVDGTSLFYAVDGEPIESEQAIELMLQIAKGIEHAHEDGMLHRDIKSANILIDHKYRVKVADFGLARQQDNEEQEEVIWGTPGYAAPEVLKGPNMTSVKSDVYALGGILYFMLTGKEPHESGIMTQEDLDACDARFLSILIHCFSEDLSGRYDSVTDLIKDLESLKREFEEKVEEPPANPLLVTAPQRLKSVPASAGGAVLNTTGAATQFKAGGALAGGHRPVARPVKIKPKGNSGGVFVVLFLVVIIIVVIAVVMPNINQSKKTESTDSSKTSKTLDKNTDEIQIQNASFEESSSGEGERNLFGSVEGSSSKSLLGWRVDNFSSNSEARAISFSGGRGDKVLKMTNASVTTDTGRQVEPGSYTLTFLLGKEGGKNLVAGKDYKVELLSGSSVLVSFKQSSPLGDLSMGEKMQSFSISTSLSKPRKSNLGVRVSSKKGTLYVDHFTLSVEK